VLTGSLRCYLTTLFQFDRSHSVKLVWKIIRKVDLLRNCSRVVVVCVCLCLKVSFGTNRPPKAVRLFIQPSRWLVEECIASG